MSILLKTISNGMKIIYIYIIFFKQTLNFKIIKYLSLMFIDNKATNDIDITIILVPRY